jgi:hypothetical protein
MPISLKSLNLTYLTNSVIAMPPNVTGQSPRDHPALTGVNIFSSDQGAVAELVDFEHPLTMQSVDRRPADPQKGAGIVDAVIKGFDWA